MTRQTQRAPLKDRAQTTALVSLLYKDQLGLLSINKEGLVRVLSVLKMNTYRLSLRIWLLSLYDHIKDTIP